MQLTGYYGASSDRDRDMMVNSNFLGEVLLNIGKLEPYAVSIHANAREMLIICRSLR